MPADFCHSCDREETGRSFADLGTLAIGAHDDPGSRMKLSVHLTRYSFSPVLRIFRKRCPRATLGKAAATAIRRAPTTLPWLDYSWAWATATTTVSTADLWARCPCCPGWKVLKGARKFER